MMLVFSIEVFIIVYFESLHIVSHSYFMFHQSICSIYTRLLTFSH